MPRKENEMETTVEMYGTTWTSKKYLGSVQKGGGVIVFIAVLYLMFHPTNAVLVCAIAAVGVLTLYALLLPIGRKLTRQLQQELETLDKWEAAHRTKECLWRVLSERVGDDEAMVLQHLLFDFGLGPYTWIQLQIATSRATRDGEDGVRGAFTLMQDCYLRWNDGRCEVSEWVWQKLVFPELRAEEAEMSDDTSVEIPTHA